MKIITADKFKDFNEWVDPETLRDLRGYESKSKDNFEVYEAEANEVDIPEVTTDEEAEGMLADSYVQTEEPFGENLGDFGDMNRSQEGLPGESLVEEEPLIKKKDEVEEEDEVDEAVAEATEIDERVKDFATTREAVQAAMDEHRVLEIFYVTKGRGGRDEKYYLKRERGLPRENGGGVNIHRIVEPHYIYTAGNGSEIVITYDRSVRRVRSFIINNIYDYNFTKNRRTKEDQYFRPRNRVMPSAKAAAISGKGIKTMKNTNDTLLKIASTLDGQGLNKSSEVVRQAEKALSNFKMAQYVGVQGYWLKNRRCWDNCYRQKRTSKSGTSAQEVWMECWDEYKNSINNEKSTWAKYAEKNDSIKISKKEEQKWNKIFAEKVEDRVKEGLSKPESIYTVIESKSQEYITKVIKASSDLMILADTLVSGGYGEIGKQVAAMSIELLKESELGGQQQNFIGKGIDKVKDFFGGFRGKGSSPDVRKKIETVISRAYGLLKMLSGSNVREAQVSGFIIEAGKGTIITREAYSKEQLDKDNAAVAAKEKGAPGEQGVFPFAQPQAGESSTKAKGEGEGEIGGEQDVDKDGVNNEQDVDDSPADNIPDDQQDNDGDGVNNEQDVDDSPADNIPDDQQQQAKPSSLRESYTSLMDDVSTLTTELSGLQTAKDPQVSQWAQGAVPLLHRFVADSSVINQTPRGERTQAIKQIVIQLVKGLQGVLAGQNTTAQPGGQLDNQQMGNQQLGDQGVPQGNQQQSFAGISQMINNISKDKNGGRLASQISGASVSNVYLKHIIEQFEAFNVPFTTDNWEQFRNQLAVAFSKQNAGNQQIV